QLVAGVRGRDFVGGAGGAGDRGAVAEPLVGGRRRGRPFAGSGGDGRPDPGGFGERRRADDSVFDGGPFDEGDAHRRRGDGVVGVAGGALGHFDADRLAFVGGGRHVGGRGRARDRIAVPQPLVGARAGGRPLARVGVQRRADLGRAADRRRARGELAEGHGHRRGDRRERD